MAGYTCPKGYRECERCGAAFPSRDDRFCVDCRKRVRVEMREAGYLTPYPRLTRQKPENYGADRDVNRCDPSPYGENAVRALEDNS